MKQKIIILFTVLVLAIALPLCCVTLGKKNHAATSGQTMKASKAAASTSAPGETPVEDATVIVDGADGSTVKAVMGVAEDTIKEDLSRTWEGGKSDTSKPTPTPTPTPEQPHESDAGLTWVEFNALSPEARDAFKDSFKDFEAFYDWMVAAQAEFKNANPDIEIVPGESIDLTKLK